MPVDLLQKLKEAAGDSDESNDVMLNIEPQKNFMDKFFNDVKEITEWIEKIEDTLPEIRKKHDTIIHSPQTDERLKQELESQNVEIKRLANKVRSKLKIIEQTIEDDESKSSSAQIRIKKLQHNALSSRFLKAMSEYNDAQTKYREGCKERIKRQLEIVGRVTTDEEIEDMLESGNPAVFTQAIVVDLQKSKQTLADIEAQHADIIKLEKSIRELHDMFMDMALLVENQGEMINSIEYNVHQAADFVETANVETKKALQFQSKARRKQICIIIAVIIILIIVGLIIYFSVR